MLSLNKVKFKLFFSSETAIPNRLYLLYANAFKCQSLVYYVGIPNTNHKLLTKYIFHIENNLFASIWIKWEKQTWMNIRVYEEYLYTRVKYGCIRKHCRLNLFVKLYTIITEFNYRICKNWNRIESKSFNSSDKSWKEFTVIICDLIGFVQWKCTATAWRSETAYIYTFPWMAW